MVYPAGLDQHGTDHAQAIAHDPHGCIMVDAGLVGLLEFLWEHGCSTMFSCQGDPDASGHLGFSSWQDLERGLNLMADLAQDQGERQLVLRMAHRSIDPQTGVTLEGDPWTITGWPHLWWRSRGMAGRSTDQPMLIAVVTAPSHDLERIDELVGRRAAGEDQA
jgi:hypothetical protein